MKEMGILRVSMVESNIRELDLENKTYAEAFEILRSRGFEVLYESRTSVLTSFQRGLYEKVVKRAAKKLAILLDPIVVAFAVHDACDLSGHDYAWLDLEGDEEIGNSAWARGGEEEIVGLALRLLRTHLEKYVLDAYDRQTREDMVRVWEAELKLLACPVCGESSLERRPIVTSKQIVRSWICTNCDHHVTVQADVLRYLQTNDLLSE
jgi:ribosomal protein L37AE/L43A